jgi:hypothetical protein
VRLAIAVGVGVPMLAIGLIVGLRSGMLRLGLIWAVVSSTFLVSTTVLAFWLNERGGLLWLLVAPLVLAALLVFAGVIFGVGYETGTLVKHRRVVARRDTLPLGIYLALFIALAGLSLIHPLLTRLSDDAMIANFQRNEATFARLVEMAQEDGGYRIDAGSLETCRTSARCNEYDALFQAADLRGAVTARGERVSLGYFSAGLILGGELKEYKYTTVPPSPLVESLDRGSPDVDLFRGAYRRIAENWYLYYVLYS